MSARVPGWRAVAACLTVACGGGGGAPAGGPAQRAGVGGAEPPDDKRCASSGDNECFVHVPGGRVRLGAQTDPAAPGYDPAALPDEGPVREVDVAPFWIQRHEVPANLWRLCVQAKGCDAAEARAGGGLSNLDDDGRRGFPANGISWTGASQLCRWIGGRLPTEDEWELAARGADGRRWPWGDEAGCGVPRQEVMHMPPNAGATDADRLAGMERDACTVATWTSGPTLSVTQLVGASPYGLLGMASNVSEWVDGVHRDGASRILRGGSYLASSPDDLRVTVRAPAPPDQKAPDVGFRCVWGTR